MRLFHLCLFLLALILACPGNGFPKESNDLLTQLRALGLNKYAKFLVMTNPELVEEIRSARSSRFTIWAPGNDAVIRHWALGKLARRHHSRAHSAYQASHAICTTTAVQCPKATSTQASSNAGGTGTDDRPPPSAQTSSEVVTSLLEGVDSDIKLGGMKASFVKSAAVNDESGVPHKLTTGRGDIQTAVRGPYQFENGVIYEINDFFTLPQTFTATMRFHSDKSQQFFKAVRRSRELYNLYENEPAVTIFAPADNTYKGAISRIDPASYIVQSGSFLTPELDVGKVLKTNSGATITITRSDTTNEILVNGQRLVKPDVITTNGVIHFIDGLLYKPTCKQCEEE